MQDSDGISNFAGHRSVGGGTVSERQMKKGAELGLDNPQNGAPMLAGLDAVAPKQATESTRDEAHPRPTVRLGRNETSTQAFRMRGNEVEKHCFIQDVLETGAVIGQVARVAQLPPPTFSRPDILFMNSLIGLNGAIDEAKQNPGSFARDQRGLISFPWSSPSLRLNQGREGSTLREMDALFSRSSGWEKSKRCNL
ncbi:hypothetical protein QC762_0042890 [Podospora pseudocomata]|uniref:Uncharacterized protein n=1 Tax=Podospora pseudocomata TaxID=2093779 RepID=A0ABR0GNB3_9PEZI|nr:hypothetical protein QC762_0042890 [Podospora pseudocomata]